MDERSPRQFLEEKRTEKCIIHITESANQILKNLAKQSIMTGKQSDFVLLLTYQFFTYIFFILDMVYI